MAKKRTKIPAADEAIRSEWYRRTEAEYRSATLTQHFCLWLLQVGASPDLVTLGLRVVRDEMVHARMSYRVYNRAGGEAPPQLDRESLRLSPTPPEQLEAALVRTGVEMFCLGETVAVPLFSAMRAGCTVPLARKALDRILRDEVRHRDFGWVFLTWAIEEAYGDGAREMVQAELPGMFKRLRENYAPDGPEPGIEKNALHEQWGLLPWGRYPKILYRALQRDYVPRFRKLGIDAEAAWNQAS